VSTRSPGKRGYPSGKAPANIQHEDHHEPALHFYKGTPEGWHYYRERHYWKGRHSVAEGGTLHGCPFV